MDMSIMRLKEIYASFQILQYPAINYVYAKVGVVLDFYFVRRCIIFCSLE